MRERKRRIRYAQAGGQQERRVDTTMLKRSPVDSVEKTKKPWLKHLGKLKHLRKETKRIERLIHQHAEKIDLEMWR